MDQQTLQASELALHIDRLMRRIHGELHPRAAEFDHHQVGPFGGMVLLTISERQPVDIHSVVGVLGRDKSQISRLVQRFERLGLVQREKSPSDGRVSVLTLTASGVAQVSTIKAALTAVIDDLFDRLSTDEKTLFASLLVKVLRAE